MLLLHTPHRCAAGERSAQTRAAIALRFPRLLLPVLLHLWRLPGVRRRALGLVLGVPCLAALHVRGTLPNSLLDVLHGEAARLRHVLRNHPIHAGQVGTVAKPP